MPAAEYLTLASGFKREHAAGILDTLTQRFHTIDQYLTTADSRPRFAAFTQSLLRPLYDELGVRANPSDSDERKALRATRARDGAHWRIPISALDSFVAEIQPQ